MPWTSRLLRGGERSPRPLAQGWGAPSRRWGAASGMYRESDNGAHLASVPNDPGLQCSPSAPAASAATDESRRANGPATT